MKDLRLVVLEKCFHVAKSFAYRITKRYFPEVSVRVSAAHKNSKSLYYAHDNFNLTLFAVWTRAGSNRNFKNYLLSKISAWEKCAILENCSVVLM